MASDLGHIEEDEVPAFRHPSVHVCCSCKRSVRSHFSPLAKKPDGSFVCDTTNFHLPVDERLFSKSPRVCQPCRTTNYQRTKRVRCDVCDSTYFYHQRYAVKRVNGVLFIGSNQSVIYDDELKTGYACMSCYRHNRAALAHRNKQLVENGLAQDADTVPLEPRKRRKSPLSPLQWHQVDAGQRPSPSVETASVSPGSPQVPANLAQLGLALPHQSTAGDSRASIGELIDTLRAVERAKSETGAIMATLKQFLSVGPQARGAIRAAIALDHPRFDFEAFVSAQERAVETLAADMAAIDADRRFYAAELNQSINENGRND